MANELQRREVTILDEAELPAIIPQSVNQPQAVQLAAAILDKRLATARAFPRSVSRFKSEATDLLTNDLETAKSAEYARPVGGGVVKGPSVRLAELAAMCWGNLEVEVSSIEVGEKHVTVRAVAWDLQRNYRQEAVATTTIVTKTGQRYKDSMIETAVLSTASKAKRNAILSIIPRAYVNELLAVARRVANGTDEPLESRRQKLLEYYARAYRVQPEQIFAVVGVEGVEDIGEEQIDDLRAIANALRDGTPVEEFFPVAAASNADKAREKLAAKRKPKDAEPVIVADVTGPREPGSEG